MLPKHHFPSSRRDQKGLMFPEEFRNRPGILKPFSSILSGSCAIPALVALTKSAGQYQVPGRRVLSTHPPFYPHRISWTLPGKILGFLNSLWMTKSRLGSSKTMLSIVSSSRRHAVPRASGIYWWGAPVWWWYAGLHLNLFSALMVILSFRFILCARGGF